MRRAVRDGSSGGAISKPAQDLTRPATIALTSD
jgi:hypothetical protein